ncbi:hypothetical protein [Photorhabdus heterorhabditis]|uniref:Uncharacterized protein n=1 Tax=Photorhabdus heterorhabditis TaxID=880156 RepID=A0A5B0X9N5_9GAMM|nr:hypothetical protein [Photorhabdus heterorhabditis]KAA1194859.1 hypothetical protein F0L16_04065 [Photorhabdus heterorhabditis]MBS9442294.1 hypothetical protein [Photorhabdus heterorhabditis]
MSKPVFTIKLSKAVSDEILTDLKNLIPEEERSISTIVRTGDSVNVVSVVQAVIVEIIHSKPACLMIASILCAWIKAKHGKKVKIKKNGVTMEFKNLTSADLAKILEQEPGIELAVEENKEPQAPTEK